MGVVSWEVVPESSSHMVFLTIFIRYRFTATLILLVLLAGRRSPHQVLDKYVNTLVNFTPTDGQAWWACESGTLGDSGMISFTWWQFEKLSMSSFLRI